MSPAKRPKRAESPKGRAGRAAVRRGESPRSGSGKEKPSSTRSGPSRSGSGKSAPGRPGAVRSGTTRSDATRSDTTRSGPGRSAPTKGRRSSPAPRSDERDEVDTPSRSGPRGRPPRGKADRGLGGTQVEGRQAVRELLLAGRRRVKEVLVADDQDDTAVLSDIVDLALELKVPVREVSRKSLFAGARTESPQGVVATAAPLEEVELDDIATARVDGRAPFLIAADGVTDPGNLGALLRSAEVAGATGVVLPRHRAVHVTPTVAKAAAGAIEHLPMAVVGGLPAALLRLRDKGVWVVGLDAGGDRSLFEIAFDANEPVCLVLGAEGKGLSRLVRQRCDTIASLPLVGQLASLNVAAAGAVACFEITRRRALTQPSA